MKLAASCKLQEEIQLEALKKHNLPMYYLIYSFFYLFSLLPFPVIYLLGDGFYILTYYIFGYRKNVVMQNLKIAFPHKTEKERIRIAKDFYHSFIDTFIEIIKMISMSKKRFLKYVDGNSKIIDELFQKGKNIQIHCAHHFNWEYANWYCSSTVNNPYYGVYMPLTNKALDKIFSTIRKRFGTKLIAATDFRNKKDEILKDQYTIVLIADQNPGSPQVSHWLNFLNKPAAFVTGPAKGAVSKNTAVIFSRFIKKKRGHYYFHLELITENAAEFTEQELTLEYKNFVEQSIKEQPANYLWSHRRWKWEYKDEYQHLWINDKVADR